jgi:hypothetical protein
MKPAMLVAVGLTFLALFASLHAQQKAPTVQLSKDYLDVLGTRLRLGMTKADVAEKLVGVQAIHKDEDEWFFDGATIQFKNERVSFADRQWVSVPAGGTSQGNTPVDALFGLVNSLNMEGYTACAVSADTISSPSLTTQRVWLHCGNKSALILKNRIGDKLFEDVYEQLGSLEMRQQ